MARTVKTERAWLNMRSPQHEELDWLWEQNETRFEGGHRVLDELWRFDWETIVPRGATALRDGYPIVKRSTKNKDTYFSLNILAPGEHYRRRQESAPYTNYMDALATDVVGHMMKQAPAPDNGLDFGQLGQVRRKEDIDTPRQAEQVYYNTDGVGVDGSQWDSLWATQMKLAMVTGYRWIFVDAPPEAPGTRGRELQGFRPYVVPFSPRSVWNYHYENGVLQWATVKIATRRPKVVRGTLEGNKAKDETLLLVRRGYVDLGVEYAAGGWWRYDSELEEISKGNWNKTNGEIPMVPLIYDRHPFMLGRPGLTELGNVAIAAMNLHSAADFDAFDASGSVIAVRGVDSGGFNLFIQKIQEGNRYAPLPTNRETEKDPSLEDASQGAVVADVFDKRLLALDRAVNRIRGSEVNSAPQASGLAQQAGFSMGNVPRLAIFAGNVETAQNAVITWFEQRFGHANQSGSAKWRKDFELIKLTSSAQAILQLQQIAGIHSDELESRVIVAASKDEGYITDNAMSTTIENELKASARVRNATLKAAATPQVPGARSTPTPPEPAQTNDTVKSQLDGPTVE